jgi:hypothetical protein
VEEDEMIPIDTARALTQERHHQLRRDAERCRLVAALPAGPGRLQRLAFLVAGWGRRPAVVSGRPVVAAPAYEPSAT